MDRRRYRPLLILLAGMWCGGAAVSFAAPPASPTPASRPSPATLAGGRIRNAIIGARESEQPDTAAVAERLARMTPEERETFKRNLHVWQQMPLDERQALRKQFNERKREEIQSALKESGLNLSDDQREVFALRYLQERRKLERDIQEQANAERSRRLPEIIAQLKREFAAEKTAAATPGAVPASGGSPASH